MAFTPSVYPFVTPFNLSGDSTYGTPNAVAITANPAFGLQTVFSGVGGAIEIRPYGNLLALAEVSTPGLMVYEPGGDIVTRLIVAGNATMSIGNPDGSGGNMSLSVVPSTSVQLHNTQVGGTPIGAASDTLNIVAGTGINLVPTNPGGVNTLTISAPQGALNTDYFVVTQPAADLPHSFNLGSLSSGILKQSVASSISTPAIATGNTDYMLPNSYLLDLYSLTPSAGSLFYFTGGHWTALAPSSTVGQVLTTLDSTDIGWANSGMAEYAPIDAYYLVARNNGTLTNEVNLGSLSTGLVLSTVSGGNATITTVPETTFGLIAGANVWTASNTFNNNPLFPSGATLNYVPTCTNATTGAWTWQPDPGLNLLATNNVWTGTNTFTTTTALGNVTGPVFLSGGLNVTSGSLNLSTGQQLSIAAGSLFEMAGGAHFTGLVSIDTGANLVVGNTTGATGSVLTNSDGAGTAVWSPAPASFTSATVTTSDATPTTLISVAVASGACSTVWAWVAARNSGSDFTGGLVNVTVGNNSGTLSIINTPFVTLNASSTATFNAVVSGTNLIIQVTGIAATTYVWDAQYIVTHT